MLPSLLLSVLRVCVCYVPAVLKLGYSRTNRFLLNDSFERSRFSCLDIDIFAAGGYVCVFSNIFDLFSSECGKQSCSVAYAMLSCAICKLLRVH